MKNRLINEIITIGLLLTLVLGFFARQIFGNEYFAGGDLRNQFYPWKTFLANSIKNNKTLPLWNPYTFSGNPFLANLQVAMFYPLDVIFYIFQVEKAFQISVIMHFFLASLFMYLFCRFCLELERVPSFVSATIYTFNGFSVTRLFAGNITLINGVPWIPLAFLFFIKALQIDKKKKSVGTLLILSLILASQILCGHPQMPYYTLLSLFFYLLYKLVIEYKNRIKDGLNKIELKKRIFYYLFAYVFSVGIASGLAAVQLLPSLELAQFSTTRAGGATYEFATSSSLAFRHLLIFFSPTFFGTSIDETFWGGEEGYCEVCGYLGILPLVLTSAVFVFINFYPKAKHHAKFLIILGFISLFFAFGRNNPFYPLFFWSIPGLRFFRCPARWLIIFSFCISALSGIGAQTIKEYIKNCSDSQNRGRLMKKFMIGLLIIGMIILATILLLLLYKQQIILLLTKSALKQLAKDYSFFGIPYEKLINLLPPDAMPNRYKIMINSLGKGLLFYVLSVFILFLYWRLEKLRKNIYFMLIALLIIDLWSFSMWFIPSIEASRFKSAYFRESEEIKFLKQDLSSFRVLCLDEALSWIYTTEYSELRPNRLMVFGIFDVRGYDPTILRHYTEFINLMQRRPLSAYQGGILTFPDASKLNLTLLSLLNVKYIISINYLPSQLTDLELVSNRYFKIYRNKKWLPYAFLVSDAKVIKEKNTIVSELISPHFNPQKYIIIEEKIQTASSKEHVELSNITNGGNKVKLIRRNPNQIVLSVELAKPAFLFLSEVYYPGWQAYVDGERTKILKANYIFNAIYLNSGSHLVEFQYCPRSFQRGKIITVACFITVVSLFFLEKDLNNFFKTLKLI